MGGRGKTWTLLPACAASPSARRRSSGRSRPSSPSPRGFLASPALYSSPPLAGAHLRSCPPPAWAQEVPS
eukprot:14173135-Alexandrium_andersonii.AAC.1